MSTILKKEAQTMFEPVEYNGNNLHKKMSER